MAMTLPTLLDADSQDDPHHWSATFSGHAWIGLGPWGLVAIYIDMWTAAWLVPLMYLICWEGLQFYIAKRRAWALFWDCLLDAVAVAFGCYAAACVGNGLQIPAIMCWGASIGVILSGWKVRE